MSKRDAIPNRTSLEEAEGLYPGIASDVNWLTDDPVNANAPEPEGSLGEVGGSYTPKYEPDPPNPSRDFFRD
jgi:hypothetical protein